MSAYRFGKESFVVVYYIFAFKCVFCTKRVLFCACNFIDLYSPYKFDVQYECSKYKNSNLSLIVVVWLKAQTSNDILHFYIT